MLKKKQNDLQLPLSTNCKVHDISWKDERWSASEKDLEAINKALRENNETEKLSLFRRAINMIFSLKRVMKWIMKSGFGS